MGEFRKQIIVIARDVPSPKHSERMVILSHYMPEMFTGDVAAPIHDLLSQSSAAYILAHPFAANSMPALLPYTFDQGVGAIAFTAWPYVQARHPFLHGCISHSPSVFSIYRRYSQHDC